MPFFRKPYKSETTQFIEQLRAARPALAAEPRAGRALLWDKALDRERLAEFKDAQVPQQPYVYQTQAG